VERTRLNRRLHSERHAAQSFLRS